MITAGPCDRFSINTWSATIADGPRGASGGLAAGGLPLLDLNSLVAAVVASVVPASRAPKPAAATTPTPAAVSVATKDEVAASSRKAARKKAAESKSASAKAARHAKAAKKTTSALVEHASRTYRRVPDDFEQVLGQAGDSANIVADHYGVPRHTVYSWIRSARKKVA